MLVLAKVCSPLHTSTSKQDPGGRTFSAIWAYALPKTKQPNSPMPRTMWWAGKNMMKPLTVPQPPATPSVTSSMTTPQETAAPLKLSGILNPLTTHSSYLLKMFPRAPNSPMGTEVRTGMNASPRYNRSPERYASQNIAPSSQGTFYTLNTLLNPDPPYPRLPSPVPFQLICKHKLSDTGSVTARLSLDCLHS